MQKLKIYFSDTMETISHVGMNNLVILKQDKRIKSLKGLGRKIAKTLSDYRPSLIKDGYFQVLDFETERILCEGFTSKGDKETSKLYYEITNKPFAFLSIKQFRGYLTFSCPIHQPLFNKV